MIAIVTDSSAHLLRKEAEELGVTVVPMSYSLEGQAVYIESCIDENGEYEKLIEKFGERMRTSQATFSAFMAAYDELITAGHDVLCLTMSSRLSGTYGNARMAAEETMNVSSEGNVTQSSVRGRIRVVDSLTTSGGLYLLIREARRMADEGYMLDEMADALKELRNRIDIAFSVDDIRPLRQSGRLGSVRLSISTILNIKPALRCINGSIVATGVVRGRQEQLRTLVNSVPENIETCVVEGFMADEQVEQLSRKLTKRSQSDSAMSALSIERRRIGPVLSIHLGIGCVGVAWLNPPMEHS